MALIRVTIELVPFGDEDAKETLDTVEIVNDGTGSVFEGNYEVSNGTRVVGHPRHLGVVPLVIRALGGLP